MGAMRNGPGIMHATEWIQQNASYQRTLTSVRLRGGLGRQKGHCTWCDGTLPKGSRSWCSQACREEGYVRFGFWHGLVKRRDKGVCALCRRFSYPYEIDHIVPVVEGGGCCGLPNLRTLCFPCHKQVTKALAGRRAAARRDKKRTLFRE